MKALQDAILKSLLVPILLLPTTMWAADRLWHMLRYQTSDTTQARVVGLLLFAACTSVFYASKFYVEISPVRRDERLRRRFRHDATTDISTHRREGTHVCTKCLHTVPAQAYPLHDSFGQGQWGCGGCGATYRDERWLVKEREALTKQEEQQRAEVFPRLPFEDGTYS